MDMSFRYIAQLAFGYWQSEVLFALARHRIFEHLRSGPQTAGALAGILGFDPQVAAGLLNAGVALKLLKKEGDAFANTETSNRFLLSDSPETLAPWVRVMGRWVQPWSNIDVALRTGRPVECPEARLGDDSEYLNDFILGMDAYAVSHATEFADRLSLGGHRYLLDVGGGRGTYAVALCKANPELRATVLDLDPVLSFTKRFIAANHLEQRIDTRVGDYRDDSFGGSPDVILLSNILHQEPMEVCQSILARAYNALIPGGKVAVHGHFVSDDGNSPSFVVLHNLSALLLWHPGRSYAASEIEQMVLAVGFRNVEAQGLSRGGTLIITASKD